MCGITGFAGIDDKGLLKKMGDIMEHRGPDDSGYFYDKGVGLLNRRLSIIDLSGGKQPISNEDQSAWVVSNNEIYNYKELMEQLEKKGHRFKTECDTEVILHSYEEWGENCVKKFNGMFAFAIWDSTKKELFLARDRLGIKPLYYTFKDGRIVFGSEIKAILQWEDFERKLNFDAVYKFLSLRYIPHPETIFVNINKLPPGTTLTFKNKKIKLRRYWDIDFTPNVGSENYYCKKIFKLMEESVKRRLMSEVPLGALLSGGIDSSSVVALMSKHSDEPVKTFTASMDVEEFNELKYARIVSEKFGAENHEVVIEPKISKLFPEVVWHLDEPVPDPAAIPTYLISKKVKKDITVVLVGEGGDELFGGYEHYNIMSLGEKYGRYIPRTMRSNLIPPMVKMVPGEVLNIFFKYSSSLGEKGIERFANYLSNIEDRKKAYLSVVSIFNEEEKEDLFLEDVRKQVNWNLESKVGSFFKRKNDLINQLQYLESKWQMSDSILMKVDKSTMAWSIEARVPILDHKLFEFVNSIPQNILVKNSRDKYLFRKAFSQMLPREIVKRKKQRFFVPIHSWMTGELGEIVEQMFSEKNVKKRGYFNYKHIRHIIENLDKSKLYYSRQLWNLLTFEVWYRVFMENEKLKKPKWLL